jgi:integrase
MTHHTRRYNIGATKRGARIYKRSQHGTWTYKANYRGKTYYFPLGLDKTAALDLADQIKASLVLNTMQEVQDKFLKKQLAKDLPDPPTLGQILKAIDRNQLALGLKDSTVDSYQVAIRSMVKKVLGKKRTDDVDDFDMSKINNDFVRKYRHIQLEGITDASAVKSRKRSINSRLRNVKALLNHKIFEDFDMSFAQYFAEESFYKKVKKQYRLPKISLIEDTFDLWKNIDGDEYIALGLALNFGLRRGEILHARRDWFNLRGEKARVDIYADRKFDPKGFEGYTQGSKQVAKLILNKASDDYLLHNRADSGRPVFDRVLDSLREIGWDRQCPLHECRKLFGSYIASTENLFISQKFLRHSDAQTTSESYADALTDEHTIKLWAA